MAYQFEICANSLQSCIVAEKCKANRVELCAALTEGGTTPSWGMIKLARDICQNVKLHVIIRPRGGDFLYSEQEIAVMEQDLKSAMEIGVDGVVFGCLTKEGQVDIKLMEHLLTFCKEQINITFHRAFDVVADQALALEQIIGLKKINRILTSGGEADALQGVENLKRLNKLANNRIILLAGAGVNENNIKTIAEQSGICEFHFSGKGTERSLMQYHHPCVFMGLPGLDEYDKQITSEEKVRATMQALLA